MGEVDMSRVKTESEFNGGLIQNGEFHSSYVAPLGWDIQPRAPESVENKTSNAITTVQNNAIALEEDTNFSASPICPAPLCRQFWKAGNYEDVLSSRSQVQNSKNYLHVHPKFLHSNATSHKWAFGAIAELLDNAIDEIQNGASFVIVDKTSNPRDGTPALLIQDDGGGMDPEAVRRCMSFGFSDKGSNSAIGRYGNGFKTSTMRLGADVIVFTRHMNNRTLTQSIGLLSYTYLSRTGLDRIFVPMVDYEYNMSSNTFKPLQRYGKDHFQSNISIILQWSPFQTEAKLMEQFDDIGLHGTKVILYNLWFTDDGALEFDFESDPEDIRLRKIDEPKKVNSKMLISEQHIGNQYRYSLRVYVSILYLRIPQNFNITLRGKIVEHRCIAHDLKYPEFIIYKPQTGGTNEEILTTIGFLKEAPDVYIHGFNVYHKNRLILPFWPVVNYERSRGRGVVGVLEANFVEPTHNKQDFERTSLFQKLENRLKEMTWEYWDYHCGLIGYQVIKKVQARSSSFDYVGHNDPRLQPISVDKSAKVSQLAVGHADHVKSSATTSLATQSNFQQSGFKRTQDDLLSSLGRGRRQSRAESNTHNAGPERPMENQPVFHTAMLLSPQEAIKAPEQADIPPVARTTAAPPTGGQAVNPLTQAPQATAAPASGPTSGATVGPAGGPNASPLDLFPQGLPNVGSNAGAGSLDFLRNSQQFQALRAMVQANPQILQPMLQELGKQNPQLMRLIQEHQADFLRLINEPVEGGEGGGNLLSQLTSSMPPTVSVTPEEREAIERLEAMGFRRATVLQVYFACNKNEELAANYLLDHMDEFENEDDEGLS